MGTDTAELEKKIAAAGNPREKAELLNELCVALRPSDKHGAWNAIRRAVQEAAQSDSPELLAMSKWRLGACSRALGHMDEAILHCEEALKIAREAGLTSIRQGIINSLGAIYQQGGDLQKALELYEEGLALAREANDTQTQAVILSNIGLLYVLKNNFRAAFENYHKSLQLYHLSGQPAGINLLLNIAQLYVLTGNFKEALEYLFQVLPMARGQKNIQVQASILSTIIGVHREVGQIEQAVSYIPETTGLLEQAGDHSVILGGLIQFNMAYIDAHDFKNYEETIRRAELLLAGKEHTSFYCDIQFAKGYFYFAQKEFLKAAGYCTEIIESFSRIDANHNTKIRAYLHRALSLEALGDFAGALRDLDTALTLTEEVQAPRTAIDLYAHLARIHEHNGNIATALEFYKKYSDQKIRLLSEAAWYQSQNLLMRFDMEKAQQQAELLRLRNESLLKDSALQQQELKMLGRFFVQTSEMMQNIRQQVEFLKTQTAEETTQQSANKLLKYVKTTLTETDNRRTFEHTFEKTHGAFIQQLAADFPALTPTELRVSALLKTGLNTKEIASTLNLSTRTVEEHRGNIRRKMAIPAEVKLGAFFASSEL